MQISLSPYRWRLLYERARSHVLFVVKHDQLSSEMRNVTACFYDVTTRMLCFQCWNVRACFYDVTTWIPCFCVCLARQLSTDLESLEISCRQENSQSAFAVVACVLCTFVPSCLIRLCARLRVGIIFLLVAVSENIPSWHGLCLSRHGHRLCRDIAVVLIASIAIWILDNCCIFIVKLETGDSQNLKYGGLPYHKPESLWWTSTHQARGEKHVESREEGPRVGPSLRRRVRSLGIPFPSRWEGVTRCRPNDVQRHKQRHPWSAGEIINGMAVGLGHMKAVEESGTRLREMGVSVPGRVAATNR